MKFGSSTSLPLTIYKAILTLGNDKRFSTLRRWKHLVGSVGPQAAQAYIFSFLRKSVGPRIFAFIIVNGANWLRNSKNFKRSVQSCFVLG